MSTLTLSVARYEWSRSEIVLFRVFFVFLLLLTIPLDPDYFHRVLSVNWLHPHFQDLFQLTNYVPRLFYSAHWGIASYTGWGVALLLSVAAAFIWGFFEKGSSEKYNELYYSLRALLRLRLAIGLIGYGVIKLIPIQFPHPTLSDLHTAYGDFLPWKLYYLSTGVASAYYQQTLGAIEILAGFLLLSRKTTAIGAGIAISLLINIVLVNFAYQIGEHLYSVYLLLIAVFVLAYDVPRLYQLLVRERLAKADHFKPAYNTGKWGLAVKSLIILFAIIYASVTYAEYHKSNWPYADTPGLAKAYGVYNVKEFRVNNTVLPYSITDTTRWQDVVFEKWNVLSIKTAKQPTVDFSSPEISYEADSARTYESKGNGGRAFFNYAISGNIITLTNNLIPSDARQFNLARPDSATIVLTGLDSKHDSLHIILQKLPKEYLINKGRHKKVTVY
jgi:hypothetical protein